jgi:excisionase family DNA binding protein
MARRLSLRSLRGARTYTIEEAATALGVTTGTVRSWVKAGLPLMKSRRPYLILGEALRDFLQDRATASKVKLRPDQLYCLTCKAARTPMGHLVDFIPQTAKTARLLGLCDVCGGACNRMVGKSQISQISQIFNVAMKDGPTA